MKAKYRHTQYGTLVSLVFLMTGILIAVVAQRILAEGRVPSAIFMLGVYLLGLLMFYSFTIEISAQKLKFWFGIGIIQKTIALKDIQSIKEIYNPWYYFGGIKLIAGGWYYAIAPGTALEIELRDGRIIQLGTNQPVQLNQAIETARRGPGPAGSGRG
jgi:hypothetical protein